MIQKRSAIIIFVAMLLVVLVIPVAGFAADSTMLSNPAVLNKNLQKGSGGGVPVGTVITWPVGSNPEDAENWLECNGQAISQAVYPELFAVMGGRVPNYQGLFLRGYGAQTTTHYGTVTHQSGALGAVQGDAIRNLYGRFGLDDNIYIDHNLFTNTGGRYGFDWVSTETAKGYVISFDASRIVPTANENRPVNTAVRYLIRAR